MSNTPDDPMQDSTVLASAYLDGEVTPDERAQVESSPELLAEVDQLRQVRALVAADAEPAAVSVREAHLAAALDVFDQLGMGTAAASSPTPISTGRARRERRSSGQGGERARLALSVAAGLVVLAGVGAVVRGVVTTSDDDSAADSSDEPAAESEEGIDGPSEAEVLAEVQGENTNDGFPLDIDASEVASDALERDQADEPAEAPAEESAEAPADDEAMEESAAAEAEPAEDAAFDEEAGEVAGGEATTAAGDAPPEVDVVEIFTPQDLADLAAPAAYAPTQLGDAEVDFADLPCIDERPDGLGIDRFAEPAFFDDQLVNIGVDLETELAFAFLDDCTIVLDALVPTEDEFLATNPTVPPTTAAP